MAKPELSLFYYPTTTIYIDDNREFLNALTISSNAGASQIFDDPAEGLNYIDHQYELSKEVAKFRQFSRSADPSQKLFLPHSKIYGKLGNLNRFSEPSVLVVDYSMPQLNGLELCAQVKNPNIKKVLLTGVANEKQAINALNADLIDFYIGKNEEDVSKRLDSIITTQRSRYFMDLSTLSNHEASEQIPFLFDAAFADYFEQACEEMNIVEYYYVTNPSGFLLIDENGYISRIIVYNDQELDDIVETLEQNDIDSECINLIKERKVIPHFQNQDGEFNISKAKEWRENVQKIDFVDGDRPYYCCILEKSCESATCYKDYTEMPSARLH